MLSATMIPSPDATTDFGVMCPEIVVMRVRPGGPGVSVNGVADGVALAVGAGVVELGAGELVDGLAVLDVGGGAAPFDPPHATRLTPTTAATAAPRA